MVLMNFVETMHQILGPRICKRSMYETSVTSPTPRALAILTENTQTKISWKLYYFKPGGFKIQCEASGNLDRFRMAKKRKKRPTIFPRKQQPSKLFQLHQVASSHISLASAKSCSYRQSSLGKSTKCQAHLRPKYKPVTPNKI